MRGGIGGMSTKRYIVTALLLSLGFGCAPTPSAKSRQASWAKGTFDGVTCEVRGYENSSSLVGKDYHELTAGENTLRVQAGHITANGKDYGEVKAGDSVLMDSDGAVSINGQKK